MLLTNGVTKTVDVSSSGYLTVRGTIQSVSVASVD